MMKTILLIFLLVVIAALIYFGFIAKNSGILSLDSITGTSATKSSPNNDKRAQDDGYSNAWKDLSDSDKERVAEKNNFSQPDAKSANDARSEIKNKRSGEEQADHATKIIDDVKSKKDRINPSGAKPEQKKHVDDLINRAKEQLDGE
ncbi:MAG: hypothetical protein HQK54_11490, partial [Oligoflexales bacterium]|nr:hypothetical protein [Oligoflexales bacterium]